MLKSIVIATVMLITFGASIPAATSAMPRSNIVAFNTGGTSKTSYWCGGSHNKVYTSIDFGCSHKGNPILDMAFAIIRFLSDGVGLVIIGSLVLGGIQYSISQGDPQATAAAVNRIRSTFLALLVFIFAYALLNYLIPGQVLQ